MTNNSESFKPICSNLDDVKNEVARISLEENKEEAKAAIRNLHNDLEASGWLFHALTIGLVTLMNSTPPDAIPEEQQALFVVERLLTPRPDLAAFMQALPV